MKLALFSLLLFFQIPMYNFEYNPDIPYRMKVHTRFQVYPELEKIMLGIEGIAQVHYINKYQLVIDCGELFTRDEIKEKISNYFDIYLKLLEGDENLFKKNAESK